MTKWFTAALVLTAVSAPAYAKKVTIKAQAADGHSGLGTVTFSYAKQGQSGSTELQSGEKTEYKNDNLALEKGATYNFFVRGAGDGNCAGYTSVTITDEDVDTAIVCTPY
jgi:hypothetical protein